MKFETNMNNLKTLIKKRRAVFPDQYNGRPIEKEVIEQILETANWAPTHKHTEPWRFKVLQGESKNRLGEFLAKKYRETTPVFSDFKHKKIQLKFQQSACVIAICMQRDPKESLPEWEEIAAISMAVQNMWLLCTELEIGCYWSSPGTIQYMNEFFDFEPGEKCLGFFYMGYFDGELPEGKRKSSIGEKTEFFD